MRKMLFISLLIALGAFIIATLGPSEVAATSPLYSSQCQACHGTNTTCAGCHAHGVHSDSNKNDLNLAATTDMTTYAGGAPVTVTLTGGYRAGWARAILYSQTGQEIARSSGSVPTGFSAPCCGNNLGSGIQLTASAPNIPGIYTWAVAWYGNQYDLSEEGGTTFFGPNWTPDASNPGHGYEFVSTNSFTVVSAAVPDRIGIYREGKWLLDTNGVPGWQPGEETVRVFGWPTDIPVTGDWNGDGIKDMGLYRGSVGRWFLDTNGVPGWQSGEDVAVYFGLATDIPVTGDWNGDGITEMGLYRGGWWLLDTNGMLGWQEGQETTIRFGMVTDIPVTGDWNGDGITEMGLYRDGKWLLDTNGVPGWQAGEDTVITVGLASDIPVTGDWNGDGITDVGLYREGWWFLDTNGILGWQSGEETSISFGTVTDVPVSGAW